MRRMHGFVVKLNFMIFLFIFFFLFFYKKMELDGLFWCKCVGNLWFMSCLLKASLEAKLL